MTLTFVTWAQSGQGRLQLRGSKHETWTSAYSTARILKVLDQQSVADLRGCWGFIIFRPGPKFFRFHAVFGKICQNRILAPPGELDWTPPGKSWIHHWQCHKFSKSYPSNFSTEFSSQIFDCCPRNFLIQEERIGNVVSTMNWITPVYRFMADEPFGYVNTVCKPRTLLTHHYWCNYRLLFLFWCGCHGNGAALWCGATPGFHLCDRLMLRYLGYLLEAVAIPLSRDRDFLNPISLS